MQLRDLLEADRAVSPVIGVILMVGIVVTMMAILGTFVLGVCVTFALVGLGNLSTHQLGPALQKTRHCRLAGIVTGTPEKEKIWAEKYGIPERNIYNYENYDQIRDNPEIDVIYVVLPNGMHAEYTIRAAQAGKHVLCEKPMANSARECREMTDACKQADRKLAIGYRCQFEPHNMECIRLARENAFGEMKIIEAGFGFRIGSPEQPHVKWRLNKEMAGGGALMDVGIYALQACRYLTGEEPATISAQETKTNPEKFSEVDESIAWTMKFPGGVIAYCSTTYIVSGINRYTAYADNGWFGLDPAYSYGGIHGQTSEGEIDFPQIDQFAAEMDAYIEDGTGYTTKFRQNLMKSSDGNFRPVDMEFAPDGSLYVVDWLAPWLVVSPVAFMLANGVLEVGFAALLFADRYTAFAALVATVSLFATIGYLAVVWATTGQFGDVLARDVGLAALALAVLVDALRRE
jgi:flagellin-like protein